MFNSCANILVPLAGKEGSNKPVYWFVHNSKHSNNGHINLTAKCGFQKHIYKYTYIFMHRCTLCFVHHT